MDMVGVATNFYYMTFKLVTDATKVAVQFFLYRWMYQRLAILGAEYDMYIVFYERLSHGICITPPLQGWFLTVMVTPSLMNSLSGNVKANMRLHHQ